ncbi:MAG: MgtC/SapB family protein [Bacteroidota bacterium]
MALGNIEWTIQLRFAVALALGFLVGLERESTKGEQKLVFGGVRTNPIISMFGFGCAWLYQVGATFMLPAGLIAIATLTGIGYVAKIRSEKFGTTSEISALLTFIVGALAMLVDIWIAMAIGIINTILLSEKAMMESYVERLSKVEFLATVKFLLITLIIYPVLPNQDYTQFHINPAKIWQIVIIVSTLGFVGYLLEKKFGERVGLWLSGLLGGIVSSTAVTVSVARMARVNPECSEAALQASIIASSVTYLRVLALVWFVNPLFVPGLWYRMAALAIIGAVLSIQFHGREKPDNQHVELTELQNPFEIKPAIGFALLFVLLTVITGFIKISFGDVGLLGLSVVVGVTDITPFILSIVHNSDGTLKILNSAVVLSLLSNTIIKGIYFGVLSKKSRKETAVKYSILALSHIPFIFF